MIKLYLTILLFPIICFSQDYVDVLKLGYGRSFQNNFEGAEGSTYISTLEANLTLPIVLNKNNAIITGGIFSRNKLQLYPPQNGLESPFTNLYSTTLKVGLSSTFSERWGMTLVFLPKIASDYHDVSSNDFFMGGFGILKYQKRENVLYRFGLYSSSEAFGFYTTPILGWYSLSKDKKIEMDIFMPISVDINYTSGEFTYGFSYFGIGRSFNIEQNDLNQYVQLNSLEFAGYAQYNRLFKNTILRAKLGYASDDYEVHTYGDKIDFGFIAFNFGDDRQQNNPKIQGSMFFKLELIYRIQL
ncbi:DUF6268 family outer membrane beta-barrel protein [Algibacter mikhailovii]|uniref:DUF6268 domain-containing protein n=1 Tax=Algibacter mikhailovii TaxID=425498 RepID=A0A918V6F3_9FLAO|nr:DUF6268 family outer membrane beta-barrel protein [Algibacter mikhailovii]GGZ73541.1 hypothetical protein GCM10007028_08510 [Algibacter mikhailovii]